MSASGILTQALLYADRFLIGAFLTLSAVAFYATPLDLTLKTMGVDEVFLAGVATDMAVESTAREAHDRDLAVKVIADCCIAANEEDQQRSLTNMKKLAAIITSDELDLA